MIIIKYFFIDDKILVSIYKNGKEFSSIQQKKSPSIERLARFIKGSKNKFTSSVNFYSELIIIFLVPRND